MKGHLISQDSLVEVPAAIVWDVYRGVELGKVVSQSLPDVIGTVEVVHGDGGVGTILKVIFPPGSPGPSYMKEMFAKVDDEQRLKESEIIGRGFKDIGFQLYRYRIQIIEKDGETSIIKSSLEYEIDDKLQEIASQATTEQLEIVNDVVGKYLIQKWDSSNQ